MLSIEEDGELRKRDLAEKPDRQSITAIVRKPVGMANWPLPILPSVRAAGLLKSTLVADFLGSGYGVGGGSP